MTTRIPAIYKGVFLYWDPPCALWGVGMCLFTRDFLLNTFFPSGQAYTRDAAHDILLYHQAGALIGTIVLNAGLLRYTKDIGVWKFAQAAILSIDLAILAGLAEVFGREGRLAPSAWQAGDWVGIAITVGVSLVRLAFLAGVGFQGKGRKIE
ncbi:hypothetical protein C8035_v003894 [Colletotrichum spinosum]|uniref:DUF7704 domain-containing protein n=1 Tax=Colletotrichum spinosum TaxID=1347390 RepID=A0A4R8PT88_9PEZI|nr:hypothetical protein C8035_v003894 [Colletotrichum spinosum]